MIYDHWIGSNDIDSSYMIVSLDYTIQSMQEKKQMTPYKILQFQHFVGRVTNLSKLKPIKER